MQKSKSKPAPFQTERFQLRPLTLEDVTPKYHSWLLDEGVKSVIVSAASHGELEELRGYVKEKSSNPKVWFLGIFTRTDNEHIGNLKFENMGGDTDWCDLGILIGDSAWRGKGVATEVILGSARVLKEWGINRIYLSVKTSNGAAIRSYEKAGFVKDEGNFLGANLKIGICMVLRI